MDQLIKDLEQKLKSVFETLKQEIASVRTNRPTPQLVENIQVDYQGQNLSVKQLGSISVVPPRELTITVWDKSAVQNLAKAIESSPLGIKTSVEGVIVRLRLPSLTEERRQELVKLVKGTTEKTRIKVRSARDEANKKIGQAADLKTISEDQKFKSKKRVQELVDKVNKEIDGLLEAKIREINE